MGENHGSYHPLSYKHHDNFGAENTGNGINIGGIMKRTWDQLREFIGLSTRNMALFPAFRNIVNSMPDKKRKIYEQMIKDIMHTESDADEIKAIRKAADYLEIVYYGELGV